MATLYAKLAHMDYKSTGCTLYFGRNRPHLSGFKWAVSHNIQLVNNNIHNSL
jgi:hypothetical protein